MTGQTLGDTLDAKARITRARACQDCPCCYTPPTGPAAACSADPELVLVNGQLTRRPEECPMVGRTVIW